MSTALITGGTAGLGAAFARYLAADGCDLILVARNQERLKSFSTELAGEYGVSVSTASADLTTDEGCATVRALLGDVDILVNNAGIGLNQGFSAAGIDDEERLLNLNVRSVLRLSHEAFASMRERGRGTIINVSSVAGFGPTMPGSTYNASKAWVIAFSESIGLIGRSENIRVMALCPGFVRTEFHESAGIATEDIPGWMWLNADAVVESGMRDLTRGKLISVPSVRYKFIVSAIRHMPLGVLGHITSRLPGIADRGHIR